MPITLKSEAEMDTMREAGRIVGRTLARIREMVRPGLNLLDVEAFVAEEFRRHGAVETFRGYAPAGKPPYPSNICASVNDELVHGIPRDRRLNEGDIVTFDLGATYKGFVGFAFFYTIVQYNQQNIAKNLQQQGAFIPGIRPGPPTEAYLLRVVTRITWGGALFLGAVAVAPFFIGLITDVQALTISSAGFLIVVAVVLDTMKQLEAQLLMRNYEGFIR